MCYNYFIRRSTSDEVVFLFEDFRLYEVLLYQLAAFLERGDSVVSSDVMRGYNDFMILSLLLEGDSYGYEISRMIREISGEKYVMKETTLYSAFTRLDKGGYIVSYFGDETNGKRRTYYKITPEGEVFYSEKCEEWSLVKEIVDKFVKK